MYIEIGGRAGRRRASGAAKHPVVHSTQSGHSGVCFRTPTGDPAMAGHSTKTPRSSNTDAPHNQGAGAGAGSQWAWRTAAAKAHWSDIRLLQKAAVLPRLGAHWQVNSRRPSLGFPFPFPFPLPPLLLPKPSPFFLYPIIPITQQHGWAAGRDAASELWAGPSTPRRLHHGKKWKEARALPGC